MIVSTTGDKVYVQNVVSTFTLFMLITGGGSSRSEGTDQKWSYGIHTIRDIIIDLQNGSHENSDHMLPKATRVTRVKGAR